MDLRQRHLHYSHCRHTGSVPFRYSRSASFVPANGQARSAPQASRACPLHKSRVMATAPGRPVGRACPRTWRSGRIPPPCRGQRPENAFPGNPGRPDAHAGSRGKGMATPPVPGNACRHRSGVRAPGQMKRPSKKRVTG